MVEDGTRHDHSAWEAVVLAARERARARQALMVERYSLSGDVQYAWSMDDARMTWSRGGQVFLTGRITMIGSVSLDRGTWLWAWANDSLPRAVVGDIEEVRRFGEAGGFPVLPWQGFDYHPELVAEARMVAASVLDADGLWAESTDGMQFHFLLHDLTRVGGGA
ncbi:DUF6882 domain-containing protein [Kitasatospora paracochleata]|uniref:Uncharacterized protein n=1 Tax=Kitasatospora paracochleata TaxID=58354 RepID=A0ABT1JAJ7_9ACTN|nr:DUF6882 domain-containing protein [Kitasatospora paracochleata]MCP2314483.1 hypothetical protein [Kitasatospora paracochleata]